MIPGWGQTVAAFGPLIDQLAGRYPVLCIDLPGHGGARNMAGPYSFTTMVTYISRIMQNHELTDFYLLGWSMGGALATLYALDNVQPNPTGLILLSATPRFVAPAKESLGIGQHPTAVKKMQKMVRADPSSALRGFIHTFFASGEIIDPEMTKMIYNRLADDNTFPPITAALIETLDELMTTDLTVHPSCPLTLPMLVLSGALDRVTPRGGQRLWDTISTSITHHLIDRAGHAPQVTQAPVVAKLLTTFIEKNKR
jgi:pimeloyl-ACP methyl ester carboxylesterase